MKKIILIILVIGSVSYYNDPKSLDSWKSIGSNIGMLITNGVKFVGESVEKATTNQHHFIPTVEINTK